MAVADIYCVKMFGDYLGQAFLNVFFYEQVLTGSPSDALGLHEAFDEDVLVDWVDTVVSLVGISNLEVFQPENPTDFHDGQPGNNVGTRAVTSPARTAAFEAFAYRSNRDGPGSRASYKRFVGLSEEDTTGNLLEAAFLAIPAVVALATSMGQVIASGGPGATYKPIQVKHPVPLGIPVVKNFDIISWLPPYLTTQVSRRSPSGL